jgi:hypothetical protein
VTAYDERQLRKMREILESDGVSVSELRFMTSSLDALFRALEENEKEWNKSFYDAWAMLDDAYSEVQTQGLSSLPKELKPLIQKGVGQARLLVDCRLGGHC